MIANGCIGNGWNGNQPGGTVGITNTNYILFFFNIYYHSQNGNTIFCNTILLSRTIKLNGNITVDILEFIQPESDFIFHFPIYLELNTNSGWLQINWKVLNTIWFWLILGESLIVFFVRIYTFCNIQPA